MKSTHVDLHLATASSLRLISCVSHGLKSFMKKKSNQQRIKTIYSMCYRLSQTNANLEPIRLFQRLFFYSNYFCFVIFNQDLRGLILTVSLFLSSDSQSESSLCFLEESYTNSHIRFIPEKRKWECSLTFTVSKGISTVASTLNGLDATGLPAPPPPFCKAQTYTQSQLIQLQIPFRDLRSFNTLVIEHMKLKST